MRQGRGGARRCRCQRRHVEPLHHRHRLVEGRLLGLLRHRPQRRILGVLEHLGDEELLRLQLLLGAQRLARRRRHRLLHLLNCQCQHRCAGLKQQLLLLLRRLGAELLHELLRLRNLRVLLRLHAVGRATSGAAIDTSAWLVANCVVAAGFVRHGGHGAQLLTAVRIGAMRVLARACADQRFAQLCARQVRDGVQLVLVVRELATVALRAHAEDMKLTHLRLREDDGPLGTIARSLRRAERGRMHLAL
mmetsp:Transcript_120357/g.347870  ORF Transcript_120357/g.347870 Transcript_120357/m.347870 type:complete len:248 (-) Transcript_120357:62-805(-)